MKGKQCMRLSGVGPGGERGGSAISRRHQDDLHQGNYSGGKEKSQVLKSPGKRIKNRKDATTFEKGRVEP